jgi:hypothetical protein
MYIADARAFENRLILRSPRDEETIRVTMISAFLEIASSAISIRRFAAFGKKCHDRHGLLCAGMTHQCTARQHSVIQMRRQDNET